MRVGIYFRIECVYLRNEFDFWNVHGIINTSGLLQITLQETRSIHDSMNIPKLTLLLIFLFIKYLNIEIIYN